MIRIGVPVDRARPPFQERFGKHREEVVALRYISASKRGADRPDTAAARLATAGDVGRADSPGNRGARRADLQHALVRVGQVRSQAAVLPTKSAERPQIRIRCQLTLSLRVTSRSCRRGSTSIRSR